jgi:protein-disulfide isomerase
VVAMLEAAGKQDKFWLALEAILASQSDWVQHHTAQPPLVWKHLEGLGLNLEQMRADMMAPEIARVIAQDLDDARTLNVTKTPEFFVNGKPLPRFGYEPLKALVDEALSSAQR